MGNPLHSVLLLFYDYSSDYLFKRFNEKGTINEHTDQLWTWWWILIPNTTGSWTCAVRINRGEEGNLNLEWKSYLLLSHNECFPLWYFKAQPLGISLGNQSRVTMSIWNCFYTDMRKPHSHVFNINEITISFPLEVFITLGKQMGKKCHAIRCWSSWDLDTSPPCWTSALLKQLYRHLGNTTAYAIFIIKH